MQNYSAFRNRKIIQCLLPECSCERCTKLRLQAKHAESLEFGARNKSGKEFVRIKGFAQTAGTTNTTLNRNPHIKQSYTKYFTFPNLAMPTFRFTPQDFSSVLFDTVGIVSFFIMISIMFWITVCQYLWAFIKKLFQADRNVKLITLALFFALCIGITLHALNGTHQCAQSAQATEHTYDLEQPSSDVENPSTVVQRILKRCHHKKCLNHNSRKSNKPTINKEIKEIDMKLVPSKCNSLERKSPSLCDLCATKLKAEKTVQPSLSDEEARQMYKRYKLYTVPSEMKFPPSFGHVFEVLSGLFEGLPNTVNRTFS